MTAIGSAFVFTTSPIVELFEYGSIRGTRELRHEDNLAGANRSRAAAGPITPGIEVLRCFLCPPVFVVQNHSRPIDCPGDVTSRSCSLIVERCRAGFQRDPVCQSRPIHVARATGAMDWCAEALRWLCATARRARSQVNQASSVMLHAEN
eukprot:SAG31_NODE_1761_length_7326_cov_2.101148_10_plen_150_part_00